MRVEDLRRGLGCAAVVAFAAGHALAVGTITPIALSGRSDALGPNHGGATFAQLNNSTPVINSLGQICFRGQDSSMPANGTGSLIGLSSGTGGVWTWDGALNNLRAQIGDPTPDASTYTFSATGGGFSANQLANDGTVYYKNEGNSNFVQNPAAAKINRMGNLAPGIAGGTATFSATSAGTVGMASNGTYLLQASMANGVGGITNTGLNRNDSGVWVGSGGSLTLRYQRNQDLVALAGGQTPSGSPTTFAGVRMGDFSIGGSTGAFNANGTYAWRGQNLQGSVVTTSGPTQNNSAIFADVGGTLQAVARAGDMAIGTLPSANTTYANFGAVALNNANHIAFNAGLRNNSDTFTTPSVYSNHQGNGYQLLARRGEAVPAQLGYPAGTLWGAPTGSTGSVQPVSLGHNDDLLINVSGMTGPGITSTSNTAFVINDRWGNWKSVARTGDSAPAIAGTSVVFSGLPTASNGSINALGQVAFSANLTGTGITAQQNDYGLFVRDWDGTITCIAQTGSAFHVGPGDDRLVNTSAQASAGTFGSTMSFLLGSGGEDGRGTSLSDTGMLTFALHFQDGTSGVFTVAVPAPSSLALIGLGGLVAARRRRA